MNVRNRPTAQRRVSRPLLAGIALAGALVFAGCGDDETTPTSAPAAAESSSVDTLVSTGLEKVAAGEDAEARGIFAGIIAIDPDNVYAHYNLGFLAQRGGDAGTAVAEYTEALETDQEFAPALYNLGILTETADLEAAVDLYQRVLEVEPEDAATLARLGFALQELGEKAEGAELLAQAVEIDPTLADAKAPDYR